MRVLQHSDHEALGLDIKSSAFTHRVGSVTQRSFVNQCMREVDVVLHTATLHKPHIATHTRQDFVDTNITGTLSLLEEAVAVGVKSFVFTSTTSAFGALCWPLQARRPRGSRKTRHLCPRTSTELPSWPPTVVRIVPLPQRSALRDTEDVTLLFRKRMMTGWQGRPTAMTT